MNPGSQLIAIGLAVTLFALGFELLSLHLSGLAVGTGLVLIGFLVLGMNAATEEFSLAK